MATEPGTPPITVPPTILPTKYMVEPTPGEVITAAGTKNTYTMGSKIGEGHFGVVYSCQDTWDNHLAAKVFKPLGTYEKVRAAAEAEFRKLLLLRNPFITFVYDAFEYRDTIYIITERCDQSIEQLLKEEWFVGPTWIEPIARCLLQAVHYLHMNQYVHQDIHPGNVFTAFARDEMASPNRSITFKLGDLGV